MIHAISPCLWFDSEAEDAAGFYVSIFSDSRIVETSRYLDGLPRPAGSVMTVRFLLQGQMFLALNGGRAFPFSPAISFAAECDTQDEVDHLWEQLSAGGQESRCGWLVDQFGVSWQIVPRALIAMLTAPDRPAAQRAVNAMLTMQKLDIAALQQAFAG